MTKNKIKQHQQITGRNYFNEPGNYGSYNLDKHTKFRQVMGKM